MSTHKGDVFRGWLIFGSLLLLVWLAVPVWAQLTTTGTITGTVRDASGAAVPQASITITDQNTGVQTSTISNSDGSFVAPGLPPGTYAVKVSKPGFETFTESGILLHPAQVATVNLTVRVGRVTTQIRVAATAAEVQTSTPEVSSEVSEKQVETLPLNGRNYQSLSALMPGVTNLTPGTAATASVAASNLMSVNGMGQDGTMYYVDGISDGLWTNTNLQPNLDAIEEVRVLQSNYGVQYSLEGTSAVVLQTKSGTDTFHGTAFEYLRNTAFDARNFFSATVSPLKQNIFGFSLGGPVYVPHHYNTDRNKTFFFVSSQWTRQDIASVLTGSTATAAMRNGTFNTAITDPLTGKAFPQTSPGVYQIPQSMLNSSSLAFVNAMAPLPNYGTAFVNYVNLNPSLNRSRQDEIKIEHSLTTKQRLMLEYLDERTTSIPPDGLSVFNTETTPGSDIAQLAQVQWTSMLTPSMVNTASVAMNWVSLSSEVSGIGLRNQIPGFDEVLPYSGNLSNYLPEIEFSQGWTKMGVGPSSPNPNSNHLEDTFMDDWNWLRGKHHVEAGINVVYGTTRGEIGNASTSTESNGLWDFTGQFTGNAIADFLLGDAATFTQSSNDPREYLFYRIASPYVQDTWKATRRLTVTAGLRWDYMPLFYGPTGTQSVFNPPDYVASEAPTVTTKGTIVPTASYNPLNGIVINGENGIPKDLSNAHQWYWAPTVGVAWDVFGNGRTSLRGGYGIDYYGTFSPSCGAVLKCGNNPPILTSLSLVTPSFPNPIGAGAAPEGAPELHGEDFTTARSPYAETFSLSLEHQFAGNWLVSLAGAGNALRHGTAQLNFNEPLPDPPYDYNPIINSGTSYTYLYGPYLGYGGIFTDVFGFNAYWDALEVNVRHPVGHNVFLSANYTWEHALSIGDGSLFSTPNVQDAYEPGNSYGNAATFNAPQVFATSVIWTLPWFKSARGWKGPLLGGWQYSDITTIQSGFSTDPGISTSTEGLASRPDRVANTSITGPGTVAEWFNTAAFAAPPAGYFGDAAPGSIPGPGLVNFDMAFYKNFHITERQTIEFRAELFNIFNHTNLSSVSTSLGAGNFGQVTAARDPRIAELVLRYQF